MVNENLLKNTRLAVNTDKWVLGVNVTRDPTQVLNGCVSIKSVKTVAAYAVYWDIPIPAPGSTLTFSVWYKTDVSASLPVSFNYATSAHSYIYGKTAGRHTIINDGGWHRAIITNTTLDTAPSNAAFLRIEFSAPVGTAWFACPKLERGSVATPYTPSHWDDWTAPITDRTLEDIQQRNLKAFCNVRDLQRLEENIECLADVIGSSCNRKIALWQRSDFPKVSELGRILANITALRQAYYSYSYSPSVPLPPLNTWQKWNDAEQLLLDIYTIWNENQAARSYAGELCSGQQIGVI